MHNVFATLLSKLHYIAFFLVIWAIVLASPVSRCILPTTFGFDAQNVLAWKYAAVTGVFPVRDVFYPYGLLPFFKDTNIFVNLFATLLIPTFVLLIAIFFGKRMHSTWKGLVFGAFFFVFTLVFSDLDAFLRYGTSLCFLLFFLVLNKVERSKSFTIGLINGLIFTLVTDQGLLALVTMGVGSLVVCILEKDFPIRKMISSTARYLAGFFVGFVPLALYLLFTNGLLIYIASLLRIPSIAAYAESPFLPFATHPENLVVFLPLFSLILLISYTQIFRKPQPFTRLEKSMIFIIILTIVLEQRSLVRSISGQIVFMGPVLWMMFVLRFLRQEMRTEMKIFALVTSVLALSLFAATTQKISNRLLYLKDQILSPQPRLCLENTVKQQALQNPAVPLLKPYIKEFFPLYVYPSEAVLYAAFSSPLPPYFNSYNNAPLYAQLESIAWFEQQQTGTVVINTAELEMEGIPHVVRTPTLLAYIFSNYCPTQQVEQYLIMSRCKSDIPTFAAVAQISPAYAAALAHVNLGEIPRKEWAQKHTLFTNTHETLPLNQKGLYVLLTDTAPHSVATLSAANATTTVEMNHCEHGCVIDPKNLPVFYFEHTLIRVDVPATAHMELLRSTSPLPW